MRIVHAELKAQKPGIDLGLALLSIARIPGMPLTQRDISAWCGCSSAMICNIEKKALKKVRTRLNDEELELLGQILRR